MHVRCEGRDWEWRKCPSAGDGRPAWLALRWMAGTGTHSWHWPSVTVNPGATPPSARSASPQEPTNGGGQSKSNLWPFMVVIPPVWCSERENCKPQRNSSTLSLPQVLEFARCLRDVQSGIKNTTVAFLMLLYMKRVASSTKKTQSVLFISAAPAAPEALRTCRTDGSASHTDTSIPVSPGSIIPGWLTQGSKVEALCLVRRRINSSKWRYYV